MIGMPSLRSMAGLTSDTFLHVPFGTMAPPAASRMRRRRIVRRRQFPGMGALLPPAVYRIMARRATLRSGIFTGVASPSFQNRDRPAPDCRGCVAVFPVAGDTADAEQQDGPQ